MVEQALAICERLDDHRVSRRSLHYIAEGLRDTGEFERAAELYTRSIEVRRAHGLGNGAARCTASATSHSTRAIYPPPTSTTAKRSRSASRRGPTPAGLLPRGPRVHSRPHQGRATTPGGCGRSPSESSTRSASACSPPSAAATSGSLPHPSHRATSTAPASPKPQRSTPTPRPRRSRLSSTALNAASCRRESDGHTICHTRAATRRKNPKPLCRRSRGLGLATAIAAHMCVMKRALPSAHDYLQHRSADGVGQADALGTQATESSISTVDVERQLGHADRAACAGPPPQPSLTAARRSGRTAGVFRSGPRHLPSRDKGRGTSQAVVSRRAGIGRERL